MPQAGLLTADEVIVRILDLMAAIPEAAEGLPDVCRTKEYWQGRFGRNDATRRLMEMLREMPAFTNHAPAAGDAAGWRALMAKDFAGPEAACPKQAAMILRHIAKTVITKPFVEPPVTYWRQRFGPEEVIQRVRPTETDEWLPNPHRGTATFQRFQGDDTYASWITSDTHGPVDFDAEAPVRGNQKYIPRTTLSYCRWPWRWLEPQKGQCRWELVEQALATAKARGQTLQVRFQPYTRRVDYGVEPCQAERYPPESSVNVPDWYWDTGAPWIAKGAYAPNEPDSNHPLYLKHFGDFIKAFACQFDGHPDLESVDMAYAGFWGESGGNSTPATARKLIDIYLRRFRKTPLLSMLGTPGCKYAATKTRPTRRHVGWRADCFGDLRRRAGGGVPAALSWNHTFDAYPEAIARQVKDAWMTAPVTMETCGNVATWFLDGYDLDTIIREGFRYHMSVFMPKSVFFPAAMRERLEAFDRTIGYRFVLRQLKLPLESKPGKQIRLQFFIDNVGCAPIYRPYQLALRFRQGGVQKVVRLKADIRTWLPGHTWFEEAIAVPRGLRKGEAKLDLAIVGDDGHPRVWLAIEEKNADGWHPMTSIDIA
ncbi:MAG: DUF4832 domain-containing protein [Planctomycetes bacterium]|nr:DUF4832 domain-containing protein [Planctomycetota bacterium]